MVCVKRKRFRYYKITPKDVIRMRKLYKKGYSQNQIGKIFNVTQSSVNYHLNPAVKNRTIEKAKGKRYGWKDPDYMKKYIKERLKKDKEFKKRYYQHISNYRRRKRKKSQIIHKAAKS